MEPTQKAAITTDEGLVAKASDRELERIRSVYARRRKEICRDRYSLLNPFDLLSMQEREEGIVALLRASGIQSLTGQRILDVGCGRGNLLRRLLELGAEPGLLHGVDFLREYVHEARRLSPHFEILQCNAAQLPFANASFELVNQSTVFSSILCPQMKQGVASEMLRVLKPGGSMFWYDFFVDNPRNSDVRGVRKQEIYRLYPGCDIQLSRITLAPPIGRFVAPYSSLLYDLLSRTKILCTHYLGLIKKK
jgi:ubiquinone/menaquinone biosynthesis C-methylase UbiE